MFNKPKISFVYLRKFNLVMGFLHIIQASVMLFLGLTLANISDFRLPINISYLKFDSIIKKLILQTDQTLHYLLLLSSPHFFLSRLSPTF